MGKRTTTVWRCDGINDTHGIRTRCPVSYEADGSQTTAAVGRSPDDGQLREVTIDRDGGFRSERDMDFGVHIWKGWLCEECQQTLVNALIAALPFPNPSKQP